LYNHLYESPIYRGSNQEQAILINEYSRKFIDIDSIIDLNNDIIKNIETFDSRETIRIKLLENKLTLFKRVKHFWDNQNEYNVFKVIRVRNCLSFKKVHSKTQKSGYLLAN